MTSATSGQNTRAWLTVFVLFFAQIISTIDRGMLALVIDPVRHDLGISEMQIALLQGIAFTIFYVTVGLPLGAVADVVNRRKLLLAGIAVWSAATVAGGFAEGFGSMFTSRIFIGVGEAVLGPCAVTMISDLFPPEKRGRPVALYVFGSMIAFGLGSLICGLILDLAPKGFFAAWPVVGGLAPWRMVFVLVGASGVVLLALLATVSEPKRAAATGDPEARLNLRAGLAEMGRHYRIFVPFYLALGLFATGAVAATGWGAVLLTRTFAYDIGSAGKLLGVSQLLWSVLGALVAAFGVDRVGKRFGVAGRIRFAAILTLLAVPAVLPRFAPDGPFAIVLLGEIMFVMAVYGTAMLSSLSEIAPPSLRGFAVALYAFVMTMIGGSLGPVAIAWLTESVFADPLAVGSSMALVGTVSLLLSAVCAFLAASAVATLKRGNP
ncbi:MFS transporter [Novosphingobium sp.]|uniref:MFS transporter n=1 Tax=Novosphingobium sp. TaxID=1874826 RepID=UPI00286EA4C1|nr:MFS transporter [Novosphingobium sp.]